MRKVLIYGYGNPGRQDDGLGVVLAQKVEEWARAKGLNNIAVETNYQLNIEDAEIISRYDTVIFADASQENIDGFQFDEVQPSEARVEFTMHAVSPSYIVYLCNDLFGKFPEALLLHLKGYSWDFKEGLTRKAKQNLDEAFRFITTKLNEILSNQLTKENN